MQMRLRRDGHILERTTLHLTDADGVAKTFGPGDSFVAAGFKGIWENITPVRKVYFIPG
jgi:uncharacterized cupin superfamily protein